VQPFASARLQSQFAPGFHYEDSADARTRVSGSLDPTFLTETIGLGKKWVAPGNRSSLYVGTGGTLKQTFSAARYGFADDPGTTPVETFGLEPGTSLASALEYSPAPTSTFSSSVDLFTNFMGPKAVDVRWENQLGAMITTDFALAAAFSLLYDRDVSPRPRFQQTFGFSFRFL
jgi:hypothetical protein